MIKINLKKSLFQRFLKGISAISDSTIITVDEGEMYAISSSEDNALYLYSKIELDIQESFRLNIPSVSKLEKAIKLINCEDITLTFNKNRLEYKKDGLKFVYHLLDDGVLPAYRISIAKINSFDFNDGFDIPTKFIKNLLKQNTLTGTDKVYIYTEDGYLQWKLGDNTKPNSDSITVQSIQMDDEISPFIMKTKNLGLIADFSENLQFRISSERVGSIIIDIDNFRMQYILARLTQ